MNDSFFIFPIASSCYFLYKIGRERDEESKRERLREGGQGVKERDKEKYKIV